MATIFVTGGSGFVGGRLIELLCERGDRVRGLARSDQAAALVQARGAQPVRGDLGDMASLVAGMRGCETVFHVAAQVGQWGDPAQFYRTNVTGTENVAAAAARAGVARLLHVSTESVLLGPGRGPAIHVDESYPRAPKPFPLYAATKALAEERLMARNGAGPDTIIVRPRLVWGPGDASVLGRFVEAIHTGRFLWIGAAGHLSSFVYIDNLVYGLILAAEKGRPGAIYYVTDGTPQPLRSFYTRQLRTVGVEPPGRTLPYRVAYALGWAAEKAWERLSLSGVPPLTRYVVSLLGKTITLDDDKARRELGYAPRVTPEEGLAALARHFDAWQAAQG